ncbi:hypothetical protein [Kineococcus sp. NPDC059986]|uniref:hypothetical protein n=1 Tax=Kineococcus sp. NPDC059986 TaxID=3155538 RepID=UPI00344F640F
MEAVVPAAVSARAAELPVDWDAEFWAIVAELESTGGTPARGLAGCLTRCHRRGGFPPTPRGRRDPAGRWRPVVRRPTGRERSPPAGQPRAPREVQCAEYPPSTRW